MGQEQPTRRPYSPPTLVIYGNASTLTQSGGGGTSDKGGSTKHRTN
jgi:hypothetical protein